jgi:3',5'-cyclic AMP phosphodiesterase CpdA
MKDGFDARSVPSLMVYAHLGDLHVTTEKQQNFKDLLSIAAQLEIECGHLIDFVFLPGDNADNGRPDQYRLVRTALRLLSVPVHAICGDHDREGGGLDAFYDGLGLPRLPRAETIGGVRCLFLDMCGPGGGGPDFRLGEDQFAFVEQSLAAARREAADVAVFMHSYPADLKGETETQRLNALFGTSSVRLVDRGHTHYNELANDGRIIFAATRSTGQIEEGPVGYSIVALDGGVVSWRFKALDDAFPFVLITAPADRRLITDAAGPSGPRHAFWVVWPTRFHHLVLRLIHPKWALQAPYFEWVAALERRRARRSRCALWCSARGRSRVAR